MRIPTEHFSHVPVVALSPGLLSPDIDDSFPRALYNRLVVPERKAIGSAPSSPKFNRSAPASQMSTSMISDSGHQSLPPTSTLSTPTGTLRYKLTPKPMVIGLVVLSLFYRPRSPPK